VVVGVWGCGGPVLWSMWGVWGVWGFVGVCGYGVMLMGVWVECDMSITYGSHLATNAHLDYTKITRYGCM
jgi:hypothetical protein